MHSVSFLIVLAVGLAWAAACNTSPIISDRCFVIIATIQPSGPTMRVGDTLRLHAAFTGPAECWPADTTAAALRWSAGQPAAYVQIDSLTGLATALAVGSTDIFVRGVTTGMLGSTFVTVVAP